MTLRHGTWRLRVSWWTDVSGALAGELINSGLAAAIALALITNAIALGGSFIRSAPMWRTSAWGSGA